MFLSPLPLQAISRAYANIQQVENISQVLLDISVPGQDPVEVVTPNMNVALEKQRSNDLGESKLSTGDASIVLPSAESLGIYYDENTTEFATITKEVGE